MCFFLLLLLLIASDCFAVNGLKKIEQFAEWILIKNGRRALVDNMIRKRDEICGEIKLETREQKDELIQRYKKEIFPEQKKLLNRIYAHGVLNALLFMNCLHLVRDQSLIIRKIATVGALGIVNWEILWISLDFGCYIMLNRLDNLILTNLAQ